MPDHIYVYPEYLTGASRAGGRRVPKGMLVPREVTLEELLTTAQKLGFEAEIETKHYPRAFFEERGRLKVKKAKGTTKTALLRRLAQAVVASRGTA